MKMLINATRPQEVRGAIIDSNGKLTEYELDIADAGLLKGNIYVGTVANIEPALNAAFIDFGVPKQGFLPIGDVCPDAYHREPPSSGRPTIEKVLSRRRRILVQVAKDAVGNKGAALTTDISLAGRFVVLTPRDKSDGVSRKIESESERNRLKMIVSKLDIPDDYGLIVRTSTEGRPQEDIEKDVYDLVQTWHEIDKRSKDRRTKSGTCLYQDNNLIIRMLRDQFSEDIDEVLVDTKDTYDTCQQYFAQTMPKLAHVVRLWDRPESLFSHFKLESQITQIYSRRADLPSGGSLVIEPTEALTVVDVNSGRSTSQASQAETAFNTNQEAADEIARQLRLRDLGGLVVVDFIDMSNRKHQRAVETRMKTALKSDRARSYVGSISENGLLEINRQRIKQPIRQQTHQTCPTCRGNGIVRGADFAAVSILRLIEERAVGDRLRTATIELHPDIADHIQNHYRRDLIELEQRYAITIVISGRHGIHLSEERISWDETRQPRSAKKSDPSQESQESAPAPTSDQKKPKQTSKPADSQAKDAKPKSSTEKPTDKPTDKPSDQKAAGNEDASEGTSRSSRRRRRRRSARRSKPSGQTDTAAAAEQAAQGQKKSSKPAETAKDQAKKPQASQPAQATSDTSETNEPQQPTETKEATKSSRSRRSRRRRNAQKSVETKQEQPAAPPAPPAPAPEKPKRSRRRSSRSRTTAEAE